jgi:glycosyltransferase involved in cell wall biosynthesis
MKEVELSLHNPSNQTKTMFATPFTEEDWHPDDLKMFRFLKGVLNRIDIGYIATYPPQECGIATFTKDLATAISKYTPFSNPAVVAVSEAGLIEQYPKIVKYCITKSDQNSYLEAADFLNKSSVGIVSLQHEYGIFGGPDGEYILSLLEKLQKPVVTTLHTILFYPTENQKRIIQRIAELSASLVVMVKMGKKMLIEGYGIAPEKIVIIPHGVPNVHRVSANMVKKSLGIQNRPVLSSFGLINRGKGLEYVIQAMPRILQKHPNALYLVLGETHPGVRNFEGESYRQELLRLVAELGLTKNVLFNNRFLTLEELINYLCATDIYITPYINKDQIVSGTLAYALGCGKAIISTPYLYAEEVLSNGRGVLVDFRNSDQIADAVDRILSDPAFREQLESKAYKYGRRAAWFNVAIDYLDLFDRIRQPKNTSTRKQAKVEAKGRR